LNGKLIIQIIQPINPTHKLTGHFTPSWKGPRYPLDKRVGELEAELDAIAKRK
jgi:hypothetical protein